MGKKRPAVHPRRSRKIFISYSRKDAGLVSKFEMIVRATGSRAWRDQHGIAPGAHWRESITRNIADCDRMFVFWCRHSKSSREVQTEYRCAIAYKKAVVPVQLDGSELSLELSVYNAVDVSDMVWWSHEIARREHIPWVIGLSLGLIGMILGAI